MQRVLIRGARQVLTLRGPRDARRGEQMLDLGIIQDGAVLIEDGKLRDIGPSRRVENLAATRGAVEICAEGCTVMPGFVDCHTHLIGGRHHPPGFTDALTNPEVAMRRDAREVLPVVTSVRAATGRRLEADARQILAHCSEHGTTSIEAKSGCGLDEASETKILRALANLSSEPIDIIPTFFAAHVVPPEFENAPDKFIQLICNRLLSELMAKNQAHFVDVCCDVGAFDEQQCRQVLRAARAHRHPAKVHASQYGPSTGPSLAVEYGAVSVDHLDHCTAMDIQLLSQARTIATVLPARTLRSDGPRMLARRLVDAGAAIAIGTNYSVWDTPGYSMQSVISLASMQMCLHPAEAITAATFNSAAALGIDHRCGSLEPGKDANLLILKTGDYRDVVYSHGANLVDRTLFKGRVAHFSCQGSHDEIVVR